MKIKRILLHGAPPWAPSGYGLQCRYLALALRQLGYTVGLSLFGGCHENRSWNGFEVLSCATRAYGNGVIAGNYRKFKADLVITLMDLWMLDPDQMRGLNFAPIMPVDCTPLSVMDKSRLDALKGPLLHPIAMSEFGRQVLGVAGHRAPVLPHCTKFRPDPAAGIKWRREVGVPEGLFLISKVGVNGNDDRKAFSITLQAFAEFARDRAEVGLYLHCEAQPQKSPNLAYMAEILGLVSKRYGTKVVFANEHRRATDDFDDKYMHGLYCATDVYDGVTKAEGFGVPVIEAMACGTPVIAAHNSAMPEKVPVGAGILIDGQPEWASHHHAWWQTPSVPGLIEAYEESYERRGERIDSAFVQRWTFESMKARLKEILAGIEASPANDHQRVFADIYAQGTWGDGSGPGSDPETAAEYVQLVGDFIREHRPKSVLDLGCGDGRIADAIRRNLGVDPCRDEDGHPVAQPKWTGLDVTTGHDIRTCELPAAELVLIKDVFQHWPNADIAAMRQRLEHYPHVLITNTIIETINSTPANTDIPPGHWRGVDLSAKPFSWPVERLLSWSRNGDTKVTARLCQSAPS